MTKEDLEVLQKITFTTSSIEKVKYLKQSSSELKELFFYTYNPFYRYWIKKIDVFSCGISSTVPPRAWSAWVDFKNILDLLRKRIYTGLSAENLVLEYLSGCNTSDICWFAKVLARDLGIGVNVGLLLEAFGTDFLPMFEVMKAKKIEDYKGKFIFPAIVEPKLDGVRCIAIKNGVRVTLWSRRGHTFDNYPQINKELELIEGDWVLDGELVQKKDYQSTMKQVRRKYDVDTSGSLYTVFDGFFLDIWEEGRTKSIIPIPQEERRFWLEMLLKDYIGDNLEIIPSYQIFNPIELETLYEKFLREGYEGAIIKPLGKFYEFKRSWNWLKKKPTDTLGLKIVDYIEGEGKYKGMLGAFVVKLCTRHPSGDAAFEVNVGGGYSDVERQKFWNMRDTLIGTLIEVKYDKVTRNESGGYSLRFPRFVKLRDDKTEEDVISPK